MIKEIISQQNIECIGGFIGIYAGAIMAHLNPGNLSKNNIVVIIKNDKTIWATKIIQHEPNKIEWVKVAKDSIKKIKNPIMKRTRFFEIKSGELFGTYAISEDLILNEHFRDDKSYLNFMIG